LYQGIDAGIISTTHAAVRSVLMVTKRSLLIYLLAALGLTLVQGCEQEDVVRLDRNRPPETVLSIAPEPAERVFHKYRVRWTGLDRDGVVVAYRVAAVSEEELYGGLTGPEDIIQYLLALDWAETDATESLFVFRADRPNSRSHSLYVASIDNEGKADPTPAATNFLAVDYGVPQVQVLISSNIDPVPRPAAAKGDTLPAYNISNPDQPVLIRFAWEGQDPDGSIQEWKYRLDSGSETTVPFAVRSVEFTYDPADPLGSDVWLGFHEFRLVAVDNAGAKSNENMARFIINYDPNTYIDEVWTFRASNLGSIPDKRIYPGEPGDTARFAYHFGRLAFKFHGSDLDGEVPEAFRWNVKGTLIQSGTGPSDPWVSKRCGDLFCDSTATGGPQLDTDVPLSLFLRARDDKAKVDGSPDTIMFWVNYPPRIGAISPDHLGAGTVRFDWECADPDEDTGRGNGGDRALIQYRYRIDDGPWVTISERTLQGVFVKTATVLGIPPGQHTFRLQAYNADYFLTRSDIKDYVFELQY
jgi:hypothetical protein